MSQRATARMSSVTVLAIATAWTSGAYAGSQLRKVQVSENGARQEAEVTRWLATDHVTIVKEPGKHFAFGGVARLKNGDLVVVFREGTKHGVEPIGKVCLSRSPDGGRTWLPRVTVLDRPNTT